MLVPLVWTSHTFTCSDSLSLLRNMFQNRGSKGSVELWLQQQAFCIAASTTQRHFQHCARTPFSQSAEVLLLLKQKYSPKAFNMTSYHYMKSVSWLFFSCQGEERDDLAEKLQWRLVIKTKFKWKTCGPRRRFGTKDFCMLLGEHWMGFIWTYLYPW